MITTTLDELLRNRIIEEDDLDPGVFDSFVVVDGYAMQAELEPNTMGEVSCIQRVLDDGHPEDLIFIDAHGNSTNTGSSKACVRIFKELDGESLA